MTDDLMPYSGAWLRAKTDDELQRIADGAQAGSPAFDGVSIEINRRAAERSEKRQLFWIRLTFWTAMGIGIAGIAATVLHR